MSTIQDTIILKERIVDYYQQFSCLSSDDRDIISWLTMATNTASVVQNAFDEAVKRSLSLKDFYASIVISFIEENVFPLCVERIISVYPEMYDTTLVHALRKNYYFNISVKTAAPYLDAGIVKIPIESDWRESLNVAFFDKVQHSYVLEQLISKLHKVHYQLTGTVSLVTDKCSWQLSEGYYSFYSGKNWLICGKD